MAKLHRMVKLDDRFNTHVFTFLLPSSAIFGQSSMDTFSRDFVYGHQKWTFSAVRGDSHLGASVSLSSVCEFMTVTVDVTFTMVNQEHYTKSERFEIRGCGFNSQCKTHGRRNFIGLPDLVSRNFQTKHESGWYVIELEMRDPKSNFEQVKQAFRNCWKSHLTCIQYIVWWKNDVLSPCTWRCFETLWQSWQVSGIGIGTRWDGFYSRKGIRSPKARSTTHGQTMVTGPLVVELTLLKSHHRWVDYHGANVQPYSLN